MIVTRRLAALSALGPIGLAFSTKSSDANVSSTIAHRVAVHVNSADPTTLNLMLNNVNNMYEYFGSKKEVLQLRIVTHGPGLHLLREDTSPAKARLAAMKGEYPFITLAACANTKRSMEKTEGKEVPISPLAEVVPSGVVELVRLQELGWKYLKP
jgi:intracellular sulfur oxidation DsrE/DsrF family protein